MKTDLAFGDISLVNSKSLDFIPGSTQILLLSTITEHDSTRLAN